MNRSDEIDFSANEAAGVAVEGGVFTESSPQRANACSHCGADMRGTRASWCLSCGFYPGLNLFVEVDRVEATAAVDHEAPWWKQLRLPRWAVTFLIGLMVVIGASITVRLLSSEDEGGLRMWWAFAQLGLGVSALLVAHFMAFLHALMEDAHLGVLDIVLKPAAIWTETIRDLPETSRRVTSGGWGFAAALCALVVVGGIPYSKLWNWGDVPKRSNLNLVHSIVEHAREVEGTGEEDLGASIEDFTGRAGEVDADALKELEKPSRPEAVDCVILGFVPLGQDDFKALVLGTVVEGQLRIVGQVTDGISADVRVELNQRMREIRRKTPFVRSSTTAVWLEPVLTCNVGFSGWSESGKLREPLFNHMLAEVESP